MKRNYTIAILIFSIIITLASVLLFVFFFNVIEKKNEHTSLVLTTLRGKLKEKEDAMVFAGKVAESKALQESINSHFVDPDKIDTFVGYLEGIGTKLGSEVSVKSIEIPAKTKNIVAMKLSVDGTFVDIMRTITFLENIPYQITITQIYLVEDTKPSIPEDPKKTNQTKAPKVRTWQADISFNILSLK